MQILRQDLRYGARMLIKHPGFTLIAVLTLALGTGAIIAIFSVVNSVLLRPLPYREPDRLVELRELFLPQSSDTTVSPGNFLEWHKQQSVFESLEAHHGDSYDLTGTGEPERINAERITAGMFKMLSVTPAHGRDFQQEEDQLGQDNVVIISHSLWARRFGSDTNIIGQTITLGGRGHTVIGIMPNDFQFPDTGNEIWAPMAFTAQDARNYGGHYISAIGRLKTGVTLEQASAEMNVIAGRLEQMFPQYNTGYGVKVIPLLEYNVRNVQSALMILLGAVAFVLLIVCANVANLQLARAASRQKEVAIRLALGASRLRLIRQLLTESVLLSLMGGLLGLLLASWAVDALIALMPGSMPRARDIGIDMTVLGFALAVSLLTGIFFGLAPALLASKPNLNESLKEGTRGSSRDSRLFGLRNLLVISEVGLSLVLLIAAGLMVQSFVRLLNVDPGFNPEGVITMRLSLPKERYPDNPQMAAFYEQLLQRVETVPGVDAAGLISLLPLESRSYSFSFSVENDASSNAEDDKSANLRWASPDYFQAMGIPLVRGRRFTERDRTDTSGAVIINQALARRYFSDQEPIGKRIYIPMGRGIRGEIVGVVGDARQRLHSDPQPEMYIPYLQTPRDSAILVARTVGDPSSIVPAIREQVLAIDPDQPVSNIRTMEQILSQSIAQRRFQMLLLGFFAALAMALAAIGIYGVMSYMVTQNTREIGIRMALGAQTSDVLKLVLGQGLMLTLIGIGIGIAGALALTQLISTLLFEVTSTDLMTFAGVPVLLIAVAILACYLPARSATKVDPMVALRYE